jgi:hypothetical protein
MLPAFLRYLRDNGYHVVHVPHPLPTNRTDPKFACESLTFKAAFTSQYVMIGWQCITVFFS